MLNTRSFVCLFVHTCFSPRKFVSKTKHFRENYFYTLSQTFWRILSRMLSFLTVIFPRPLQPFFTNIFTLVFTKFSIKSVRRVGRAAQLVLKIESKGKRRSLCKNIKGNFTDSTRSRTQRDQLRIN